MKRKSEGQKEFEAYFKKQALAYKENMCIFCRHNDDCALPLHGQVKWGAPKCERMEYPDERTYVAQVLQYFYGPAIMDSLMERVRGVIHE